MASPAPREPLALAESVRAVLGGLDDDPKLQGKGLSAAFARSFPDPPVEVKSLAATEVARVAVVLGVPGIAVMDVIQLASSTVTAPEKVEMLASLVGARLLELRDELAAEPSVSFETPSSVHSVKLFPMTRHVCGGSLGRQRSSLRLS